MTAAEDPLASERAAFLAASKASIDATLDAKLASDRSAGRTSAELIESLRRMVDRQVEVLAAYDRLASRAAHYGMAASVQSEIRTGRADLAMQLQWTVQELARLDGPPPDGSGSSQRS